MNNINDLSSIIKCASKEIWEHNISTDYAKGRLRQEASLQSSFYHHLRNKIGDSTLDFYNAAIYSEYHYKDKRVDLAVVAIEEHDLDETPVAIFEFKYKSQASDNPFLNDVEKILGYINNENNCLFYLGFIQNAEFAALDNNFSWLNEIQTKLGTKRLIEMSGGLFRPNEDPIWSFKQH